jgi:hypothetical protein
VFAAVEPSREMLRQRDAGPPALRGRAEALPCADAAVGAALAVLTVHHWTDLEAGLAELLRVARQRVVVLTWDPAFGRSFWLAKDYLPASLVSWDVDRFPPIERLCRLLPGARVEAVPIPHDCSDGFLGAYWRRPHAYLSPEVRRGISSLAAWEESLGGVWPRLEADLRSGAWEARHGHLLERDELDLGYRLVVWTA